MKREILFKGKDINGNWHYGNLIYGKNGICFISKINKNPISKDGHYWYINTPCYEVKPETICQFTGLLDKNGVKIFEGDKVINKKMRFYKSHELTVLNHNFRFKFFNGDVSYIDLFEFCIFENDEITNKTDVEVIGNIHN